MQHGHMCFWLPLNVVWVSEPIICTLFSRATDHMWLNQPRRILKPGVNGCHSLLYSKKNKQTKL